jgi:hypothetical protein
MRRKVNRGNFPATSSHLARVATVLLAFAVEFSSRLLFLSPVSLAAMVSLECAVSFSLSGPRPCGYTLPNNMLRLLRPLFFFLVASLARLRFPLPLKTTRHFSVSNSSLM